MPADEVLFKEGELDPEPRGTLGRDLLFHQVLRLGEASCQMCLLFHEVGLLVFGIRDQIAQGQAQRQAV